MCDGGHWWPITGLLIGALGMLVANRQHKQTAALLREVREVKGRIAELDAATERAKREG
jgi:1-acyl-sn-glycerol-3-phosphate acyltransferase